MEEIWRPVVGYEGLYEVSNMGGIRSIDRIRKNCYGTVSAIKGKTLSLCYAGPYRCVYLCRNAKYKINYVHRLVARAFPEICGEWFEGCEINHKDENPANNVATNLEVCTREYNANYGTIKDRIRETLKQYNAK